MMMKSLFAFLFLLATGIAQAQNNSAQVKEWEQAKAFTAEYLAAMPEEGIGFKPTADIRSFAEQMLHLASANFLFVTQATGAQNPYQGKQLEKETAYHTKAGLTQVVNESYDFVINAIKGLQPAQMNESVKLFNMDMPRETVFAKLFEHGAHHRGQATLYLRLKGVKPPQEKLF